MSKNLILGYFTSDAASLVRREASGGLARAWIGLILPELGAGAWACAKETNYKYVF